MNGRSEVAHSADTKIEGSRQWGIMLAKAIFDGLNHRPEAALKMLDKAFNDGLGTGSWPVLTPYQFAEICSLLYDSTKDDRYRKRALDWARANRKIEPAHAWPHALVARLSSDESERVQALAVALYLDPQSEWARQVPKKIQDAAMQWLKEHPPFQMSNSDKGEQRV
jgi:hypothetical protein